MVKARTIIFRESVEETGFAPQFAQSLAEGLALPQDRPIIWLCIGTDKAIGDCLGPLVGTLMNEKLPGLTIIGSLEDPLHAKNLTVRVAGLRKSMPEPLLIAVDASLGQPVNIGCITIRQGPLWPGAGIYHRLPPIGDISVTGVIGTHSTRREDVLHNTPLRLVWNMANSIVAGIQIWYEKYY